jgi:hypothetical protein
MRDELRASRGAGEQVLGVRSVAGQGLTIKSLHVTELRPQLVIPAAELKRH